MDGTRSGQYFTPQAAYASLEYTEHWFQKNLSMKITAELRYADLRQLFGAEVERERDVGYLFLADTPDPHE